MGKMLKVGRGPIFTIGVGTPHEDWRIFKMDDAQLRELAQAVVTEAPKPPTEEDCWRAEMQAAGVPEPLQEVMCDLLKELHGALGAELWSEPGAQCDLLSQRLFYYSQRFRRIAEQG